MKLNICFLLIIFSFGCNSSKNPKNDLIEENHRGSIKSMKTLEYFAISKFGEVTKGQLNPLSNGTEYLFNKDGNYVEQNRYTPSGELEIKIKYKYNDNGLLIETNSYYSNGEEFAGEIFFHDSLDNVVKKEKKKFPGFSSNYWKYSYDENHNMTESRQFSPAGFNETETLIDIHVYSYDSKGNQIEDKWYNPDQTIHSIRTNKFDINNLKIESSLFLLSLNKIVDKEEFKYNDKKDLIESINSLVDGKTIITKYEYIYDDNNNWISQIEFSNGEADIIKERTLTYY